MPCQFIPSTPACTPTHKVNQHKVSQQSAGSTGNAGDSASVNSQQAVQVSQASQHGNDNSQRCCSAATAGKEECCCALPLGSSPPPPPPPSLPSSSRRFFSPALRPPPRILCLAQALADYLARQRRQWPTTWLARLADLLTSPHLDEAECSINHKERRAEGVGRPLQPPFAQSVELLKAEGHARLMRPRYPCSSQLQQHVDLQRTRACVKEGRGWEVRVEERPGGGMPAMFPSVLATC